MIYYDLTADVTDALLLTGDTAWQAVSAAIEENRRGFPDTALVAGLWLVDTHCADGASQFDAAENDRSPVALGQVRGREGCVEADSNHAITLFYRDAACRSGRNEYEELDPHKPSTFQPRCLVVLLEAESRAKLRDELIESGRPLTDPLLIQVNYTTARSADPQLDVTSSSCALGRELLTLYEHDLVGQQAATALNRARDALQLAKQDEIYYNLYYNQQQDYKPPSSPPPPPPPPPSDTGGPPQPPAAPVAIGFDEQLVAKREKVKFLTDQVAIMEDAVSGCVPSAETTCGRGEREAPNPWLANGGEQCFGYSTYEALEGAYCAYWGSNVNVDAADEAAQVEMKTEAGGPYCFSNEGAVLRCTPNASRTLRSGIYELKEWARPDRPYCASDIFKQLILDNATTSEAVCREELAQRLHDCKFESCEQCISPCAALF